jgi:SRSO17 transposase
LASVWGVPYRGVVADADDGDNPHFLAGLEDRHARYVGGVRAAFQVICTRKTAAPGQRADRVLAALPRRQWRTVRWRQGTKRWLRQKCVAVRCWRVTSAGRRPIGWLVGERATRGQPEERTYYRSNLPAAATPQELAGDAQRRYAVEQFHEEAKGELGGDQYQGRLWTGSHRHAVTAMLAYSFLVWLELRQRRGPGGRGRPRGPFSPAPGPPAADAPDDPSRGCPVAPPPSGPVVGDNRSIHGTLLTKVLTKQY